MSCICYYFEDLADLLQAQTCEGRILQLVTPTLIAGPELVVLQLDGCLYIVRRDMLQHRLCSLTDPAASPFLITVDLADQPHLVQATPKATQVRFLSPRGWPQIELC